MKGNLSFATLGFALCMILLAGCSTSAERTPASETLPTAEQEKGDQRVMYNEHRVPQNRLLPDPVNER